MLGGGHQGDAHVRTDAQIKFLYYPLHGYIGRKPKNSGHLTLLNGIKGIPLKQNYIEQTHFINLYK